ncbi:MAG: heme-binding protein [Pseudomonadota bacterium]|nr:heme-binding protein [Pseudomonadota bacterium]
MLTLAQAQAIIEKTLAHGKESKFKPLGVVVMDTRGVVIAAAISDGSSLARFDVARAKAKAPLAFNMGTRALEKIAKDRPHFIIGAVSAIDGGIVPVPGGVLIKDASGNILGSVGVSGDTSDNDELAALAGISAAGLVGDGG